MRLVFRSTQHPTCPLCRESVFLLETRSCQGCRTHYHQACLEEFTGCSTLGCASTTYVEAELSTELPLSRTPLSSGELRVSARVPQPPSQIWLRAQRIGRGLRSALLGTPAFFGRLFARLDLAVVVPLLGVFAVGASLISMGMTMGFHVTISEVVGIGLALLAFGLVVFAAHAISSRSE